MLCAVVIQLDVHQKKPTPNQKCDLGGISLISYANLLNFTGGVSVVYNYYKFPVAYVMC